MIKSRNSHTTLPNALGELELGVMESVWQSPGTDAKQIMGSLALQHPSKLSTVQSTLERLVRKQFLSRSKKGHAFRYFPQVSRSELLGNLMRDVIRLLHDGSTDTILSSFVNVADTIDESALDELESLIRHKRKQRSDSHD
jgi:predicted transcriptional regulator